MLSRFFITALALTAITAGVTLAQESEESSDGVVFADVARLLQRHVFYTVFDNITVDVKDGVVTLGGQVTLPYKKKSYEKAILKNVSGVQKVVNEIEVLPPSSVDDGIRYVVASRIYNDDRLLRYAIADFPKPIHIIVRNGSVTIEGVVATEIDKRLVDSLARGVLGVVSVTNNLEVK